MSAVDILEFYTYDDYKKWDGDWELIDGIAYAMAPSPMISHQALITEFLFAIRDALEECEECLVVAEQDWKVKEDTVLRPDISLICKEPSKKYITKAPKIVVEVVSNSSSKRDEVFKFDIYQKEKVLYYILVYPDDLKAKVYELKNNNFSKVGDFTNEKYEFQGIDCQVEIDFQKIFSRFIKELV